MATNIKPGQWWNAPPDQIFRAYYRCLRECYGMTAIEAITYARESFAKYPDFFNSPMATLRAAVNQPRAS